MKIVTNLFASNDEDQIVIDAMTDEEIVAKIAKLKKSQKIKCIVRYVAIGAAAITAVAVVVNALTNTSEKDETPIIEA